jgi:hypothetical protein
MQNYDAIKELPPKRIGRLLALLERHPLWHLICGGFLLYLFIVLLISIIEYEYTSLVVGRYLILNSNNSPVTDFQDILYFNFGTILTLGYGEFQPVFIGKVLSLLEALLGVALFGFLVAVFTVKALLPPQNTIVFSKYAYYCTGTIPQCFLIIFLNASELNLGNVEISSYFKLGGDWKVKGSVTSPFITQSVQTFYIDQFEETRILSELRNGDCLRVGMVGGLGFAGFSTSIQYSLDEIMVIPDRRELVTFFESRSHPKNLNCPEIQRMFHYHPAEALTLREYVLQERPRHDIPPNLHGLHGAERQH